VIDFGKVTAQTFFVSVAHVVQVRESWCGCYRELHQRALRQQHFRDFAFASAAYEVFLVSDSV
jgi:hypothetical protein